MVATSPRNTSGVSCPDPYRRRTRRGTIGRDRSPVNEVCKPRSGKVRKAPAGRPCNPKSKEEVVSPDKLKKLVKETEEQLSEVGWPGMRRCLKNKTLKRGMRKEFISVWFDELVPLFAAIMGEDAGGMVTLSEDRGLYADFSLEEQKRFLEAYRELLEIHVIFTRFLKLRVSQLDTYFNRYRELKDVVAAFVDEQQPLAAADLPDLDGDEEMKEVPAPVVEEDEDEDEDEDEEPDKNEVAVNGDGPKHVASAQEKEKGSYVSNPFQTDRKPRLTFFSCTNNDESPTPGSEEVNRYAKNFPDSPSSHKSCELDEKHNPARNLDKDFQDEATVEESEAIEVAVADKDDGVAEETVEKDTDDANADDDDGFVPVDSDEEGDESVSQASSDGVAQEFVPSAEFFSLLQTGDGTQDDGLEVDAGAGEAEMPDVAKLAAASREEDGFDVPEPMVESGKGTTTNLTPKLNPGSINQRQAVDYLPNAHKVDGPAKAKGLWLKYQKQVEQGELPAYMEGAKKSHKVNRVELTPDKINGGFEEVLAMMKRNPRKANIKPVVGNVDVYSLGENKENATEAGLQPQKQKGPVVSEALVAQLFGDPKVNTRGSGPHDCPRRPLGEIMRSQSIANN